MVQLTIEYLLVFAFIYAIVAFWIYRIRFNTMPSIFQAIKFMLPANVIAKKSFSIDVQWFLLNMFGLVPFVAKALSAVFFITEVPRLLKLAELGSIPLVESIQNSLERLNSDFQGLVIYLVAFIAFDFAGYWTHRFAHESPFLWNFHKIHHYGEQLNLTSDLRMHPLDAFFNFNLSVIFMTVIVAVLFPSSFMSDESILSGPSIYAIRDAAWYLPIVLLPSMVVRLRHSHLCIYYGKFLDRVFSSPAGHILHHSKLVVNKNYSNFFSLWDVIFGTYEDPKSTQEASIHLDNLGVPGIGDAHYKNIIAWLIEPVKASWRLVFKK